MRFPMPNLQKFKYVCGSFTFAGPLHRPTTQHFSVFGKISTKRRVVQCGMLWDIAAVGTVLTMLRKGMETGQRLGRHAESVSWNLVQ